ncbi:S-adenosyl-L-methionine-dependent methyltransferase [Aspergillus transmontanensis]|uniref:S-adenosyl-L-methionine-dependent methyltransferase n=1 Tax=Aspergillus transmontanensis TaxID=1034304 RepID=A0A5N6VI53_9EURO|nr:S-adenosyl-L-methionine-dependent methyltransferase [Aspergillus transmontanensis]
MAGQELYLLYNRDDTESRRLDTQHEILARFMGYELLHPLISIEMNNGVSVADVGTGTGIWLKRLSSSIKSRPEAPSCHLHGFDISSEQFPTEQENMDFTIHDITQPFPSEHLGRYDIVHVRLFCLALREPDLVKALKNVVGLLRPNGYLQWEDADFATAAPNRPSVETTRVIERVTGYMKEAGLSLRVSDVLMRESRNCELQDLRKYEYSPLVSPEHYPHIQLWGSQLYRAILPVSILRSGQARDKADAKEIASRMLEEMEATYSDGIVPELRVYTVIGRKDI